MGRELFSRLVVQINAQIGKPTDAQQMDELFLATQDAGLVDTQARVSTRQFEYSILKLR